MELEHVRRVLSHQIADCVARCGVMRPIQELRFRHILLPRKIDSEPLWVKRTDGLGEVTVNARVA